MGKTGLDLGEQFKEALGYLRMSLSYVYVSVLIFAVSVVFGFVFRERLGFFDEILKELLERTMDLGTREMVFFLLQNNLQSALFALFFGVFLGIYPLFASAMNGAVVGYVLGVVYEIAGFTAWWKLLPHGIFELPAIFISFGLGIKLGFSLFLPKRRRAKEFKKRFYNSLNVFLMIVIPLLILAAIIEGVLIGVFG